MSLKIDLHCHTTESDGSLDCRALIHRARDNGVNVLAITDHDSTACFATATEIVNELNNNSASSEKFNLIPGVEISTVCNGQELHVVGLGIDVNNAALQSLLAENRQARKQRAEKILIKMQKSGLDDLSDKLDSLVQGEVICRSHLAQVLCDQGIVKDFQRAFKQYLNKKGKAWVAIDWQDVSKVVAIIKAAGGAAILAHPSKYKLSPTRLALIIDSFVEAGGQALEVAYPGLNPSDRAMLLKQVERHDLAVSQGSDFHHPRTSWTELGAFSVRADLHKTVWQTFDLC